MLQLVIEQKYGESKRHGCTVCVHAKYEFFWASPPCFSSSVGSFEEEFLSILLSHASASWLATLPCNPLLICGHAIVNLPGWRSISLSYTLYCDM